MKLADYNVQPNSTIHLLVRLYEVSDELNDVIFDLSWGFPKTGVDFLDATVFLYMGDSVNPVDIVDYNNHVSKFGPAVTHSGDVIKKDEKTGYHQINVSIKSLQQVDKLVFTLSSYDAPNISQFQKPSLRFFDKKFPQYKLCSDEMKNAANSQAIIMCCLSKRNGRWEVHSLKTNSCGNAKDYAPLKKTIASLIQQKFIV